MKDVFDIVELLKHYSLRELLNLYSTRFNDNDLFMVIKSLTWFEDAEEQPNPEAWMGQNWLQVKDHISKAVRDL